MKTLLTGVKPTGKLHIGNYFGAMQQVLKLQDKFDSVFVFIADYHALNFIKDKNKMQENIFDLIASYLAVGLDPEKVIFFQQSQIKEHTELAWVFSTLVNLSYMKRTHVYKDAKEKQKDISMGDFNYPILMAADILLYDTDLVPVGKDQKQHIEITRDIAAKFNNTFGETFKLPEEYILEEVKTIPGIDGRKMSKSYSNTIYLFADDSEIIERVKKIVTDSDQGIPENVYNIHALIKDKNYLDEVYDKYKGQYKILKDILAEDLIAFIKPMREKKQELSNNKECIREILEKGTNKARQIAQKKMQEVKEKIGVII